MQSGSGAQRGSLARLKPGYWACKIWKAACAIWVLPKSLLLGDLIDRDEHLYDKNSLSSLGRDAV